MTSARDVLHLGIDLGTSRSALTSGNGVRRYVESIVGWPKDAVAARRLGVPVLFGREALNNRLALRLYRPLEKGVLKAGAGTGGLAEEFLSDTEGNHNAARELVRYIISLAEPRRDQKLYGVLGVPAEASVQNKKALLDIAKEYLDRVLIVSQPFAVAYGIGALDGALIVDIGAGTTDLCRMHGSLPTPEDQITFPIAGDAVDEALLKKIRQRHAKAQVTITMVKELKERSSSLVDGKDRVVGRFPVDGVPTDHDVTDEMKEACTLLVDPIVDAIRKLIATYHPEFQDKIRQNVVLSGGGCLLPGLGRRIEEKLAPFGGGRVTSVEEPLYAGADGALRLSADMPAEYWDKVG
jgi:rod shape-determining protein MreB